MHLLNLGIPKWTMVSANVNHLTMHALCKPKCFRKLLQSHKRPLAASQWVYIPLILGRRERLKQQKTKWNMWKFSENSCTQTSTQVPALQILHGPKHKGQGTSPGRSRLSLATAFLSWGTRTCAVGSAKGTKWIKMSTNAQLKFWKKNQTPRFICHPKSPSDCSKGISSLAPQSCWKIRCFPHRS